jgi:hypothetical protein
MSPFPEHFLMAANHFIFNHLRLDPPDIIGSLASGSRRKCPVSRKKEVSGSQV